MCVRSFVRLLVVYVAIVSRNQACCHGTASRSVASVNPKTTQTNPTTEKVSESYYKKSTDSPKYWIANKPPLKMNKLKSVLRSNGRHSGETDDQQVMREMRLENVQAPRRSESSEWLRTGSEKSRSGAAKVGLSQDKIRSGHATVGIDEEKSRPGHATVGIGEEKSRSGHATVGIGEEKSRSGHATVGIGEEKSRSGHATVGIGEEKSRSGHATVGIGEEKSRSGHATVGISQEKIRSGPVRPGVGSDHGSKVLGSDYKGYKILESDGKDLKEGFTSFKKAGKLSSGDASFERDFKSELFRLSSGWDEKEKSMLKEIDKKRHQTIDARDDSDDYLDCYERIAPGVNEVLAREPNPKSVAESVQSTADSFGNAKHRNFDSDHIKEFNFKKTKALESFEDESSSDGYQNNLLGASTRKNTEDPNGQNIYEDLDDDCAQSILENLVVLKNTSDHSSRGQGGEQDDKHQPGEDKNIGSQSKKSTAYNLEQYSDVLQKVEEIYKLLKTPIASGAEKLGDPKLPSSETENRIELKNVPSQANIQDQQLVGSKNALKSYSSVYNMASKGYYTPPFTGTQRVFEDSYPKRQPDVDTGLIYGEYSKRKPEVNPDSMYPESSRREQEVDIQERYKDSQRRQKARPDLGYPESFRRNPEVDLELGYGGYSKRKPEVDPESGYPGYARRKPEYAELGYEGYAKQKPDPGLNYMEYSPRNPEVTSLGTPESVYSEYSKRRPDLMYPDYSIEKYPEVAPERNLASPQCKFESLNPSREFDSGEEERNLQFRSQGNEKVGRKSSNVAGQTGARFEDDLGAAENQNIKEYYADLKSEDSSRLALSHDQKYQSYDGKNSRVELSQFGGRNEENTDAFSTKSKIGTTVSKTGQFFGARKNSPEKSTLGSKHFEEPNTNHDRGSKLSSPPTLSGKPVGAKITGKNDYSEDYRGAHSSQPNEPSTLQMEKIRNNEDLNNSRDKTLTRGDNVSYKERENLGSLRDRLGMHESRDKSVMYKAQLEKVSDPSLKNSATVRGNLEEEYIPTVKDKSNVGSKVETNQIDFRTQTQEVQHPTISKTYDNLQYTPGSPQNIAANSVGQPEFTGRSHLESGLAHVGQAHEKLAQPDVKTQHGSMVSGRAFPDLKALQMSGALAENPGEGGCSNIFKCLAEMGQSYIDPVTNARSNPETKIGQSVPARDPDHSVHSRGRSSDGNTSPHGFTRDAGSDTGSDGILAGLTGSRIGSGLDDHPFYGMVTSIIEAAQEATKRRLLEERHAKLRLHPDTVGLEHPKMPGDQKVSETLTSVAKNATSAAPGGEESTKSGALTASAPGSSKNQKESGKQGTKSSPLTGSAKKAVVGSSATGSGKKPSLTGSAKSLITSKSNPRGKTLAAFRTDLLSKLKAAVPKKPGSSRQKNPIEKPSEITGGSKGGTTGSAKQKTGDGQKPVVPKSEGDKGKVGAFKKVNFLPVGSGKTVSKPRSNSGVKQLKSTVSQKTPPKTVLGKPSGQEVGSKSEVTGTKLGGQKVGSKTEVGAKASQKLGTKKASVAPLVSAVPPNAVQASQSTDSPSNQTTATNAASITAR